MDFLYLNVWPTYCPVTQIVCIDYRFMFVCRSCLVTDHIKFVGCVWLQGVYTYILYLTTCHVWLHILFICIVCCSLNLMKGSIQFQIAPNITRYFKVASIKNSQIAEVPDNYMYSLMVCYVMKKLNCMQQFQLIIFCDAFKGCFNICLFQESHTHILDR